MTRFLGRFGLCAALAVIAAAVADPIVEFASNAGAFGSGNFTDRSNLDVLPALLAGIGLLAIYLVRRARTVLADRSFARGVASRVPVIFCLQILALYVMETGEQFITYGHALGPAIWLGGPVLVSLAVHAAICIALVLWIAHSAPTLARTTLRVIRVIRAIATLAGRPKELAIARIPSAVTFKRLAPIVCRIGERAPPIAA